MNVDANPHRSILAAGLNQPMKQGGRMKHVLLLSAALLCWFSTPAHATLSIRGTDSLGNRLIYDNDLDITWYDFSKSSDTWQNQLNWASSLSINFGGRTYDDWRLPATVYDPNAEAWGYNGDYSVGYHLTGSEMGHLYYTELGNLGYRDADGQYQNGWGLINQGPFEHLPGFHWSGTDFSPDTSFAWCFSTGFGLQYVDQKNRGATAMAVHPGDVGAASVPEPTTWLQMVIALGFIGWQIRMKRRQK